MKFKSNQSVFASHACVEPAASSSDNMACWFLNKLALSFAGHGCGFTVDFRELEMPLRK